MQLSGVTDSDYLELLAGFEILSEKKWNCQACVRSTDEATRNSVKGCNGYKGTNYLALRFDDGQGEFRLDRCLGNFHNPTIGHWFRAYRQFQNGVLPFEGALMEQPAKALDVFAVIESLEFEKQEAARKNAERKAKKPNGR